MVYDAKIGNNTLEFVRLGKRHDGGYVVPKKAIEASDILMGYGIANDISFERDFTERFNKPSYGFDCGVENIKTGNPDCHFFNECIGTSDYLYKNQISSGKISTFFKQLQRLELINKKILIKMDIEGAEYVVIDDILKNSNNITGIIIEIHNRNGKNNKKVIKLLSSLENSFVLVHVHGNNSCCGCKTNGFPIPCVIELTYINKNLISSYHISNNQKHPLPIDEPNNSKRPDCEFEIKNED